MPVPLECVPNVSEGRRRRVIDRLARAAASAPGAHLLHVTSDSDHDRTVFTLAGEATPLRSALLALYEVALEEIDLSRPPPESQVPGVHPRVGAVDVVPFVPLGETPMAEAIDAARDLGREVAERFDLPVFLYEEAASTPERRNLAVVRRGGFEGLATRLLEADWCPDFGPTRPHPSAGATVIGARRLLIAFNAVLDRDDLDAAREIARAVRESSGGLPALKALGVRLASRGTVQVSMNLTDFRRTSPYAAVAAVRREAEARGLRVAECELIGLMPEAAAVRSLQEALAVPGFGTDQLLERRIAAAEEEEPT